MTATITHQTIAVLVENKAGVLARVADLFARRGYNILSLVVAPTRDHRFSRITIVVDSETSSIDQVVKQLFKLINVVEIQELSAETSIERELLIATVEVPVDRKAELSQIVDEYYGKVLSDAEGQLTISIEAGPNKIQEFEDLIEQFKVVYLQRSGRIALPKIGRSIPKHTAN